MAHQDPYIRFAHDEGHTDLCIADDSGHMLTCGTDGEVRIYKDIEDDDVECFRAGDSAHCIAYHDEKVYVGLDTGAVQIYSCPDGSPQGMATRFAAAPTHLAVNKAGTVLAAGSCDMSIRVCSLPEGKCKVLMGHGAPILSIALDPLDKYMVSLVSFSSCGTYLAGASTAGLIKIWKVQDRTPLKSFKNKSSHAISALTWLKSEEGNLQIGYCDTKGYLGMIRHPIENLEEKPSLQETPEVEDMSDVSLSEFEDASEGHDASSKNVLKPSHVEEEPDDNAISISQIKREVGFDDEGNLLKLPKINDAHENESSRDGVSEKDEVSSLATGSLYEMRSRRPPMTTEIQDPFQPGSTPENLPHRFLVWNSVGLVCAVNTEDENSIDVEFHDTSVHHSLHFSNVFHHTMAALSSDALLLACESAEDHASKVTCHNLNGLNTNKEWSIDMPEGEDVFACTLGRGWAAVATSSRYLRLFTLWGIQKNVISIPGPIVSLASHADLLMVVYHCGTGVPGDQCLAFWLYDVKRERVVVPWGCPVPLSPKSTLSWLGLTDEGSPAICDSAGLVKIASIKRSYAWIPVLDWRSQVKKKTDHYFVVGVSERHQYVRAIFCKGSQYPSPLPRPTLMMLPFKIPLCVDGEAKSQLEETCLKTILASECLSRLKDPEAEDELKTAQRNLAESLMKLFALSCRADLEMRACEVASMMPDPMLIQLTIKSPEQQVLDEPSQHERARSESPQQTNDTEIIEATPTDNPLISVVRGHAKGGSKRGLFTPSPASVNPFRKPSAKIEKDKEGAIGTTVFDRISQNPPKPCNNEKGKDASLVIAPKASYGSGE
ncbi:unnamed protein product [Darwinula stevensoni]|uniref:Minichromosome loss protein Mcl1 middle region domain-containing protein n=1 Tax=Darwinula stevensoni TaxID=69355 RepID=A0A7R9ADG1_9CRUS|nr:unnamed protein product [Darwinula stevensoni]CAG0901074.1 unnamed protein product [Darwinula stevensoni]